MFNFRYVFLLILSFFSSSVFAVDYYWVLGSSGEHFPDPTTACASTEVSETVKFSHVIRVNDENFNCHFKAGEQLILNGYASRRGSECPEGTEYNSLTGQCVPEPNECEVDETTPAIKHEHNYGPLDANGRPISLTPPPASLCDSSCKVNFLAFDGEPYYYNSGSKINRVYIATYYMRDGSKCEVGDSSPGGDSGKGPDCRKTVDAEGRQTLDCSPPRDDSNECPTGWNWSGTTCIRSPDNPEPPDPDIPPPGDGGTDPGTGGTDPGTGGTDPGTGGTDPGTGGTGPGTGGTGPGNGGTGPGNGGTGPGNGGIGPGNGEGEGEGEADGSGSGEGVGNCESGRCDFGDERGDPFGGEVRSFSESLTAAMTGMKNSPLGNSIGNIQFPTGGTCPTGSTSIDLGIGSIPIDFIEHCNFWQQISPILSAVFLAFWALISVRVFLSA